MKHENKFIIISVAILVLILLGYWLIINPHNEPNLNLSFTTRMKILSPSFNNNELIPVKYTCDGQNINPPLEVSGVPEGAKSLALVVDDPDSPSGTWIHWLVWNIDPKVREIKANSLPTGAIEGLNSFDKIGYGGPCPGSGLHHYRFKLYALSAISSLASGATTVELQNFIDSHALAQAELVGLYVRQP